MVVRSAGGVDRHLVREDGLWSQNVALVQKQLKKKREPKDVNILNKLNEEKNHTFNGYFLLYSSTENVDWMRMLMG